MNCYYTVNQRNIIWTATLGSSVLSLLGSSFMLLSYCSFGRGRGFSSLVALLALGDHLWSLSMVIMYSMLIAHQEVYNFTICATFRIIFQITAGSTIGWSACIAMYLYLLLFADQNASKKEVTFNSKIWASFHIFSWGLPTFLCLILLSIKDSILLKEDSFTCYPQKLWHFLFWFLPNTTIYLATVVLYIIIVIKLHKSTSMNLSILWRWKIPLRITLYLLIFIICWTVDITSWTINLVNPSSDPDCIPFAWFLSYETLLQLQGFLNALVYGITNGDLRRHYEGRNLDLLVSLVFSPILLWFVAFPLYVRRAWRSRNVEGTQLKGGILVDEEV